ncbi:MAG: ATP-grasp domain-containing protein [Bacteroidota bacterium]|nr:ATP-grasp domain-containing protein [Bacteroidota bacterium]
MIEEKNILICYNAPCSVYNTYSGKEKDDYLEMNDLSETSLVAEIENAAALLKNYYSTVNTLAVTNDIQDFIKRLKLYNPDVIFNFVEAVEGISSYEFCIAGLYELLDFDYTGNRPITLGNCLNKERAKRILKAYNINTPSSFTFKYGEVSDINKIDLNYPVILKLLTEDASIGISENSVVNNADELKKQIEYLFAEYKTNVIAEEYIEGRELNAAVLGGRIMPVSEIKFDGLPEGLPKIVTYEGKWMAESVYYKNTVPQCPADLSAGLKAVVEDIALKAYRALDCRDYARVDIRVNKEGVPFVIEINPNPDISTDSGFARAASAAGLSYAELLMSISGFALERKKYDTKFAAC